jgi:hypothetical protein
MCKAIPNSFNRLKSVLGCLMVFCVMNRKSPTHMIQTHAPPFSLQDVVETSVLSVRNPTLDFTGLVLPWLEIEVYDVCLCWLSPLFVSKLSLVDVFVRTMNEGLSLTLTHTHTYVHTPLIHIPVGCSLAGAPRQLLVYI